MHIYDMLCIYMTYMHSMSSFAHTLVGSSSSGSGGVERGRATNRLQRWQCGGIMHDMLKKGSWCIPLSKA